MTEKKSNNIVEPSVFQAILLDGIDQKLKINNTLLNNVIKLQDNQIKIQDLQIKNQETQQITSDSKFDKVIEILDFMLKEQKAGADEGEVIHLSGTVTTTAFTIVNTTTDPGHAVKGFEFKNDGNNTIYVGYNVVPSGEGADIIDVTSDISRFDEIASGESIMYRFNRNKIRNIYLLSSVGNSTYKLKLIW